MTVYKIKKRCCPNQIIDAVKANAIQRLITKGVNITVTYSESRRETAQNSKMWAMLKDISLCVEWPVNSVVRKMTPEEWKIIFSASLNGVVKMSEGIDGGIVMMGQSTSKFTKQQFSDLFEIMYSFGAARDVRWSEKALKSYEDYPEFNQ